MEHPVVLEYYKTIIEKMNMDGLLGENGEPLFQSGEAFCRYCDRMIQGSDLETLRAEVMALEKLTDRYQERYNIIGSVHKVFSKETPHGKEYQYLHIEQMLMAFQYTPMRFMDWLLEQHCYMEFPNVLPKYTDYLHSIELGDCYSSLAQAVCQEFYPK